MSSQISLAIVTRNRPKKLERCLLSISEQTLLPDEVLIVDNDRGRSAYEVFEQYRAKLHLKYFLEKKEGVANARNTALRKAKYRYLGFIDDDCVLSKSWVLNGLKVLKANKELSYVVGKTLLYNNNNILALAQFTRDRYWFMKHLKDENMTSSVHLDTKNVIFDKLRIVKNNLKFDPKCSIGQFDSADFDFGIQLDRKSLVGKYVKSMILKHEETIALKRYLSRGYLRGKIAAHIRKKWELEKQLVDLSEANILVWILKTIKNYPKDFHAYAAKLKISIFKKLFLVFATRAYEAAYLMGYLSY